MANKAYQNLPQIKIDNHYCIYISHYNYMLVRTSTSRKTHETIQTLLGYYPSLKHALNGYKRYAIRAKLDHDTIDSYIQKLNQLENWAHQISIKQSTTASDTSERGEQ